MEIVNNHEHSASSAEVDDKSRKRKIGSQVITNDDDIDDIDDYAESEEETVEPGSGRSKLQRQNISQPAEEVEEELDDRIESLSDIYYSPPPSSPIHNQEDQGPPTPIVRAHGQAHKQLDTAEEIIVTESPSRPETERTVDSFPILSRTTSELDSPSKKSTLPSSPSSSSAATDNPPPGKPVPDQASQSRAESVAGSGSRSLTERGTKPISIAPPIPRFNGVGSSGASTGILISTPPRNTDSGANNGEDGDRSPILSPSAKERLEQFDRAMMKNELGNGKETEQQLEDGALLRKVKKGGENEEKEEKDGEMAVTGNGRQEHLRTPHMNKPSASPPKPFEIEKKKKVEPVFLPGETDSNTNSRARLKPQLEVKNQNGESGSKEKGREQSNKRLSSHHPSDSSRLADREEAEEDNFSSTHVSSSDTKHSDRKTFYASSKTVSKTISKPQSTNAAQAISPPSATALRHSRSNSFVHDIIPETDESRSQSQETDMQVPTVTHSFTPTTPPVIMKFDLKSRMKSKTPQPKPRPLSRTSSAVEMLALGVQLGIDMDVGNDVDEKLNGELDDVDETVKKTSNKIASLAMAMESSGRIPKISSRSSKSRSRSRSVSSQKIQNVKEPVPAEAEMPLAVSIDPESLQASQPADSQVNFTHNFLTVLISSSFVYQRGSAENSLHLGAAMHLLNSKSEEISKLENQLSAEQQTNKDLLQQLSALRQHVTETNNTPTATMKFEQELAEARAHLALQTESWEKERATLTLNIETAIRGKVSAEQDRDFFREQYAMASGFVSSVRDENAELEKQIKIATDQAHSGVSLIKTTFELRTKSLEEDVRAWRRIAEFLIEKDHRTNDDIRRRAAEEPELRARCDRQESALEDFSERLSQAEMDLDEKESLFVEAEEARKGWQETTVKLNLDLNEAKTKLERIRKVGFSDEIPPPPIGHESPYRCHWRSDDSNLPCEAVFLNILVCFQLWLLLPIVVKSLSL